MVASEEKQQEGKSNAESKIKKNVSYPPFVNAHGAIPKLFAEIKKASVPPKFNQDFLETALELKSSSHRALIPLLKRLDFIDAANAPTATYKNFRDDDHSGSIMSSAVKQAYSSVFNANEYAYKLSRSDLNKKLISLLGTSEDDPNITSISGTLTELFKLSDFESSHSKQKNTKQKTIDTESNTEDKTTQPPGQTLSKHQFGLSYTINLNLPATTDIQVFNAIFKSLKENILDHD
jgi:Family of unknown function (DUF5343)